MLFTRNATRGSATQKGSQKDSQKGPKTPAKFQAQHLTWALGSVCALHQRAFSPAMLAQEFPPEINGTGSHPPHHTESTLLHAAHRLGFRVKRIALTAKDCAGLPLPLLVQITPPPPAFSTEDAPNSVAIDDLDLAGLALVTAADAKAIVVFYPGSAEPQTLSHVEFDAQLNIPSGARAWLFAPEPQAPSDDAGAATSASTSNSGDANTATGIAGVTQAFNFRWFVPELLKHKTVWRDVLLASLALQIVTLATPLFTQAIIDKVVVHRTQSTLITIGIAMGLLTVFSSLLGWGRQYLVLHTGNRVDAVLGAAVWNHLLKLPLRYFERRPTGVVAARLHAVENIREFISGAAVSLVLDLPFLLICLGVMLWYSVVLSAIAVGILSVIAIASLIMAPIFQRQLNDQFMLGPQAA